MKCNKEQFEAIKPKLEGIEIYSVTCFNDYPYLTNTGGYLDSISNISKGNFEVTLSRVECIYEIWNERIFLEACGIETQETFEITKETIIKYKMKDEFPEVFKVKLEVGKWYKTKSNCLFNLNKITDEFYLGYGFTKSMTYYSVFREYIRTELKEATEQEVFDALKNEAVKRGFVEGKYCVHEEPTQEQYKPIKNYFYHERDNCLYGDAENNGGTRIFHKGQWAKIIPTKTKKEAEKLLNCKIID